METPAQTLPEDFNGVFYFTNPTDTEFESYWNSVKYTFPAEKTVPLIIPAESPLGVQEIRKKFAKELATLMFYKTDKYRIREESAPAGGMVQNPAIFTEADLAPYIQMCISPLPLAQATAKVEVLDQTEKKMHVDEEGKRRTKVVKSGDSLVGGAEAVA
jgi:hypothetical protein